MSGNHVVRRTPGYWNGLSVDLSIEQNLMANFKSAAGCIHGRRTHEDQVNIFLLSFPALGEISEVFSTLTGLKRMSSEQHEEEGKERRKRDSSGTLKLFFSISALLMTSIVMF